MVHVTEPNGVMAVEYRRALSNVLVMRCKMKSPSPNVTDMTAVFKLIEEKKLINPNRLDCSQVGLVGVYVLKCNCLVDCPMWCTCFYPAT